MSPNDQSKISNSPIIAIKNWAKRRLHLNFYGGNGKIEQSINEEWDSYFGSYSKCKNSFSWHKIELELLCETVDSVPNDLNKIIKKCIVRKPSMLYITCIDEGVQHICAHQNVIPICIPGCGILRQNREIELASNIANLVEEYGIHAITIASHSDCGAAGIAVRREFKENLDSHSPNFFSKLVELTAQDYASSLEHKIVEQLTNPDFKITFNIIHLQKIDRPDFHHAFGAILNFVPSLNAGLLEDHLGLPMFTVSAHLLDLDSASHDLELAYKIASGSHGFANKFNEDNPFEVIACINDENDIPKVKTIFGKMPSDQPLMYSLIKVG